MTTSDRRALRPERTGSPAPWRPLLAIGAAATVIRVLYTWTLARHVDLGVGDASFYSAAANLLARGEGYVDVWRSVTEGEMLRTAHHPPGWPALLSVFSFLGIESEVGHRLVGAVLGGVVVVLLGLVAHRLVGPTTALVAAALGAIHPTLVAADGSLMAETLAGAAVLLVLLAAWWALRSPGPVPALVVGVAIGAGALVRGELLLYLLLVGLPLAVIAARRSPHPGRMFLRVGLPVVAGVVAVVGPWTARNTVLFDQVVLISINDSTVLAGANCDGTYDGPGIGTWRVDCVRSTGGTEAEEASVWRSQGLEYIRDHADRLPAVVTARLARTWGVRAADPAEAEGRHLGTQSAGNLVWLAVLLPGGILGAAALVRRRRRIELGLLLAPVVAATAVTVVGFGMVRFRHPMELSAVILTAIAVTSLIERRRAVGGADRACAPLATCPHSDPGR